MQPAEWFSRPAELPAGPTLAVESGLDRVVQVVLVAVDILRVRDIGLVDDDNLRDDIVFDDDADGNEKTECDGLRRRVLR